MFSFEVFATKNKSRRGVLKTAHGLVNTPVFMPVGTVGSVKALSPEDIRGAGAEIILGNTYHLHLRPSDEIVRDLGGLAAFNLWSGPTLTDSGGFQVYSLGQNAKISENGVEFASHLDGTREFWTPEKSIQIQRNLGADIIMAFDECTKQADKKYTQEAMERTHRWLVRSKSEWLRNPGYQALFGIIQGGDFSDLRQTSAKFIVEQDLPGVAIGGVSIGFDMKKTVEQIGWIRDLIPGHKPFYAMGAGRDPQDIVDLVKAGADMFDCVAPTRLARNGAIYYGHLAGSTLDEARFESEYNKGRLQIGNECFKSDPRPIQEDCDCYTCKAGFSRAYLRHLYRSKELLYYRLASIHNVRFMIRLAQQMGRLI